MENKFNIIYLPKANSDITEIIDYMLDEVKSPTAAKLFLNNLDKKLSIVATQPYSGAIYKNSPKFQYEYRMIFVGNYTVFYVVLNNIIEIHRVIYSSRNISELI